MTDFAAARRSMVDGQVRTSDVTDLRIIAAMLELPRERFVPGSDAALAYLDRDIPLRAPGTGAGRCLLKPMVLAKMVQAASVRATDHVLDVGCATGYSAALLARTRGFRHRAGRGCCPRCGRQGKSEGDRRRQGGGGHGKARARLSPARPV